MFGLKLALPRWSILKKEDEADPETAAPAKAPASGLSPIASAVVLAAGAGVAFWWWTQWARGRAESDGEPAEADLAQADAQPPKDLA